MRWADVRTAGLAVERQTVYVTVPFSIGVLPFAFALISVAVVHPCSVFPIVAWSGTVESSRHCLRRRHDERGRRSITFAVTVRCWTNVHGCLVLSKPSFAFSVFLVLPVRTGGMWPLAIIPLVHRVRISGMLVIHVVRSSS